MRPDERPRETPGRPEDAPGLGSYRDLVAVFRHLRPHLKARAPVIVETVRNTAEAGP